jgi:hypothetical protein
VDVVFLDDFVSFSTLFESIALLIPATRRQVRVLFACGSHEGRELTSNVNFPFAPCLPALHAACPPRCLPSTLPALHAHAACALICHLYLSEWMESIYLHVLPAGRGMSEAYTSSDVEDQR